MFSATGQTSKARALSRAWSLTSEAVKNGSRGRIRTRILDLRRVVSYPLEDTAIKPNCPNPRRQNVRI